MKIKMAEHIYYLNGIEIYEYGKKEKLELFSIPYVFERKGNNDDNIIITLSERKIIVYDFEQACISLYQILISDREVDFETLNTHYIGKSIGKVRSLGDRDTFFKSNPSGTAFMIVTIDDEFTLVDYTNNITESYSAGYNNIGEPEFGFLTDFIHYISFDNVTRINKNSYFNDSTDLMRCDPLLFYPLKNGYFITNEINDKNVYLYQVNNEGIIKHIKKLFNRKDISSSFKSDSEDGDEEILNAYMHGDDLICEIYAIWSTTYYSVYYYWDLAEQNPERQYLFACKAKQNRPEDAKYFYIKHQLSNIQNNLIKYVNKNLANIIRLFVFPSDIKDKGDTMPWFKLLVDDKQGRNKILWN